MMPPSAVSPVEGELLQRAFETFDQAAQTLQRSYATLTQRIERMDLELSRSNEALRAQLHENEAMRLHLSGILDSLSTGVLVLDEAGIVTRSNAAAIMLLNVSQDTVHGRAGAEVLASLNLAVSEHPQRLGQRLLTVAHNPMAAAPGSLLLIHDVSQMCELEARLQRQHRLAAMGEMVGRIAHEIRNPLGSVELFASLLRRDLEAQPASLAYAEQISQAVRALDGLLSNLLAYTRPERIARAWTAVEPLVMEAVTLATHAMSKHPVDVRLNLDPRLPFIWCNEGQLKQVVLNLLLNAIQAMPHGGTVTVTLATADEGVLGGPAVCMTVTDSGGGIDPAIRPRIFDPFFTTKDEGTGLGLAIVHAILDAHHGRIDVDSRVGEGTTFILLLPHPSDGSPVSEKRTADERVMEDCHHE